LHIACVAIDRVFVMLNYDRGNYEDRHSRRALLIDNRSREFWPEAPRSREPGRRPKVFLYSHDTYGLGHLRRNLAIAENLLARKPAFAVRLLTGSPVIASWTLPDGLDVTALEPVVKTGVETYAPRNSALPFTLVKAYREALILRAVIEERPDILLVDHAPAGMNAELLSTLAFIRREMPGTQLILGLRDILDSPETVREIWREQGIIPLLEHLYDRVLVYGSRALFDVVEEYGVPAHIAAKFSYCGYVSRPTKRAAPVATDQPPTVLVTAGGGEDGYFLMEAYLKALAMMPPGRARSRIVTGPLMSAVQRQALDALAAGDPGIEITASTTDLPTLLEHADLVVAMGGYNTCVEVVASGKPAILVPRAAPRAEQRMRATMFERLGLVWSLEPGPELDARLARLVESILARTAVQAPRRALDLDGASRVGDLFEAITRNESRELQEVER
jgi:predicted glycosyltransferase